MKAFHLAAAFHGSVQLALKRIRASLDHVVSTRFRKLPLEPKQFIPALRELIRHENGRHQEQTLVLDGAAFAANPLNMAVDFSR